MHPQPDKAMSDGAQSQASPAGSPSALACPAFAIAAQYFSHYGKVAILDVDYHHGNGQQDTGEIAQVLAGASDRPGGAAT